MVHVMRSGWRYPLLLVLPLLLPAVIAGLVVDLARTAGAVSCERERSKEQMSSAVELSGDDSKLLGRLEAAERTGQLDDLEIEYWVGGGLPPPHHRSDQLRMMPVDGKPTTEVFQAIFDRERPDVGYIEYRVPLAPDDLRAVATLIRETGVFFETFDEQQKPDVMDILRTEIELSSGDGSKKVKRVYYRSVPGALTPLAARVKAITDRVRAQGQKRYFDRGGNVLP